MLYSMWKKRKLLMIRRKMRSRRHAQEPCIFYLSCPELDAIKVPSLRTPGVIVLHPIRALMLINRGLEMAKKTKDRKTQRKLRGHRKHVQTILNLLETHFKMERLTVHELGEKKRIQRNIYA